MSERKVLNKYYPPDFDPSKIPRRSQPKNSQQVVRLMAPFSMRCNTCGEYIYKGKKFNARKETVEGETYYGIKIFRFYIKCTLCSAEITFKTDPKNTDYLAEHGASRNFEPWRDEQAMEEDRLARMEEEENNPMKALENRTTDSKREMDILDALQDLRTRNAKHDHVGAGIDDVIDRLNSRGEEEVDPEEAQRLLEEAEDEAMVRQVFSKVPTGPSSSTASSSSVPKRAREDDEESPADGELDEPAPAPETIVVKRKAGPQPTLSALLAPPTQVAPPKPAGPPPTKKAKGGASALGIKLKPSKGKAKA